MKPAAPATNTASETELPAWSKGAFSEDKTGEYKSLDGQRDC